MGRLGTARPRLLRRRLRSGHPRRRRRRGRPRPPGLHAPRQQGACRPSDETPLQLLLGPRRHGRCHRRRCGVFFFFDLCRILLLRLLLVLSDDGAEGGVPPEGRGEDDGDEDAVLRVHRPLPALLRQERRPAPRRDLLGRLPDREVGRPAESVPRGPPRRGAPRPAADGALRRVLKGTGRLGRRSHLRPLALGLVQIGSPRRVAFLRPRRRAGGGQVRRRPQGEGPHHGGPRRRQVHQEASLGPQRREFRHQRRGGKLRLRRLE
mmetsp:Transcript_11694/g.38474  ORF Transcript_11694/g.38474 Transcript_11694/m.38474 type:complete len:264 (-) Transcript_11694:172-963(-)